MDDLSRRLGALSEAAPLQQHLHPCLEKNVSKRKGSQFFDAYRKLCTELDAVCGEFVCEFEAYLRQLALLVRVVLCRACEQIQALSFSV